MGVPIDILIEYRDYVNLNSGKLILGFSILLRAYQ
jgi:hypothetical protein